MQSSSNPEAPRRLAVLEGPAPTAPGTVIPPLIPTLLRHRRAALVVGLITVVSALALALLAQPQYDATSQILIQPTDAVNSVLDGQPVATPANAQRDITTNADLVTAAPVTDAVLRQLRLKMSARDLAQRVTVDGVTSSNLVTIRVRDIVPRRAAAIATAYAEQYRAFRRKTVATAALSAVALGRARLTALERSRAPRLRRDALSARIRELETSAAVQTGGVELIRAAAVPTVRSAPSLMKCLLIAIIAGLAVAVGTAYALELINRRLRDDREIEAAFEAPVLARLGASGGRETSHADDFADLAARLQLTGDGEGPTVVAMSPLGQRGSASRVVHGLARHLALLEKRVLVIEADLTAAEGAVPTRERTGGLAAILTDTADLAEEVVETYLSPEPGDLRPLRVAGDSYAVLPAGRATVHPAALLGRGAFATLLAEARTRVDVVIVHAPPATVVGEITPIVRLADAVVLVAPGAEPLAEHARGVRAAFGELYPRVAGVVVDGRRAPRRAWREAAGRRSPSGAGRRDHALGSAT